MVHPMKLSLILTILLLNITVSFAQPKLINATIPAFSQKVSFKFLEHWKTAFQKQQGNVFILELIPKDQDLKNWKNMFIFSAYKGLAMKLPLSQAQKMEADSIKKRCPKDFISQKAKIPQAQGYLTQSVIMGCLKHPTLGPKISELAVYLYIRGKKDIYMFKKAVRSPSSQNLFFTKENIKLKARELYQIRICKNDGASPTCKEEGPKF
jgi:hypothetical protein